MGNNNIACVQELGKNLSREDLITINDARKREFGSSSLIDPQPGNDDWEKVYFLVKDDAGSLLAFGRLHTTKVEFDLEQYSVLGIATIVAIEKGSGYGTVLMNSMKSYIEQSGLSAIGFCNANLSSFYEKCGYGILSASGDRFLYRDPNGDLHKSKYGNDDVIVLDGDDGLIAKIIGNEKESIYLSRPHW